MKEWLTEDRIKEEGELRIKVRVTKGRSSRMEEELRAKAGWRLNGEDRLKYEGGQRRTLT